MSSDLMEIDINGALEDASDAREIVARGGAMQQVKTGYTTAVAVQHPRDLQVVHKRLMTEAKLAGEAFFYGWGAGKDKIEGPSVDLAMAAARCYHNSAVDVLPVQDTPDAWIISAVFVDLETGFTLTRQFRQSKKWKVFGKFDEERKDDIRFQIGQSKAVRNVILNALPQFLIDAAVKEAKNGVRARIEQYVAKNGLAAAIDMALAGLQKHGVTEQHVLAKCQIAKKEAMTVDHIVLLRGDLYALDSGQDYAVTLFPTMADEKERDTGSKVGKSDLNEKLEKSVASNPLEGVLDALKACKSEKALKETYEQAAKIEGLNDGDQMKLEGWYQDCLELVKSKK